MKNYGAGKKQNFMERLKRPFAVFCLLLIAILLLAALLFAMIGTPSALRLLMADLFCLMVVPAVFYGYLLVLKSRKKNDEDRTK